MKIKILLPLILAAGLAFADVSPYSYGDSSSGCCCSSAILLSIVVAGVCISAMKKN